MLALTLIQSLAVASCLGVAAHLGYFIRGEHLRQHIYILTTAALFPWVASYSLWQYTHFSLSNAVLYSFAFEWSFVISLWTSMVIYRAFFHPLNNYPGPRFAKLSKLWHSFKASKMRWYMNVWDLHAQYGEYVRTGPNEISIADPVAVELVHSGRSTCQKSPWYDIIYPYSSLQLCRDKAVHDKRRKVAWERAFSAKALRAYDSTVTYHADELIDGFRKFEGAPVNVSKWYNYFTADMMSALGFGESFNMLKNAEDHWTMLILQEGSRALAVLGPIPWMSSLINWFPFLLKANFKARDWTIAQIESRKNRKVEEGKDLMHWLLNPLEPMSSDSKKETEWLHADARLAIVAGTDTTTAALAYISYQMSKDPEITKKIRKELVDHKLDNEFSIYELQHCEYLQSIIDETMRLHPPVPDGVYRLTGPDGLQIGDHFIPPGVTVITPTYTIHRSPKSFEQPDEFIPERWTTSPELINDKKSYMPFGIGPYSCVGKQLALNEIRTVIAKVVLAFDIGFAAGEDGTKLIEETEDFFVLGLADLNLTFAPVKT